MEFTKSEEWGWAVEFKNCSIDQMLNYKGNIPWPTLSEAEQKIVDANYERLRKRLREAENELLRIRQLRPLVSIGMGGDSDRCAR